MNSVLTWLRMVGIAEGISFLLLLGVAMPLKYLANMPMAVTVVGWAHGVLFVAFLYLVWRTMDTYNKSFFWMMKGFVASLVPFGTFVWDRELKKMS
jgi:integral membrane protein